MAKYLMLKHYRGGPPSKNDVPMDKWTPDEVAAHIGFMNDFAARLEGTGEFIDGQALSPDGVWVRYDGEGRPPVTDGPFAETLEPKDYGGGQPSKNDVPRDKWTPGAVAGHIGFMNDCAARLEGTGEFIDGQALSPDGVWVRYDGEGRPPVTDGPFAETKDLIAGWMVIDVDSYERAVELAGELSAAPGAGGEPIHEWLELRPFLTAPQIGRAHV